MDEQRTDGGDRGDVSEGGGGSPDGGSGADAGGTVAPDGGTGTDTPKVPVDLIGLC